MVTTSQAALIILYHLCLNHSIYSKCVVKSFTNLGLKLLRLPGVKYLLSEVFSQDPLERYFSCQHHRGGSSDNPTAQQVPYNAATLVQQQSMYCDLKTMNVEIDFTSSKLDSVSQPLSKHSRNMY